MSALMAWTIILVRPLEKAFPTVSLSPADHRVKIFAGMCLENTVVLVVFRDSEHEISVAH